MTKRISSALHVDNGRICCTACGLDFADAGGPWKPAAALSESPLRGSAGEPYSSGEQVMLRRFSCPGCGALLDSETALPDDPFLNDVVYD